MSNSLTLVANFLSISMTPMKPKVCTRTNVGMIHLATSLMSYLTVVSINKVGREKSIISRGNLRSDFRVSIPMSAIKIDMTTKEEKTKYCPIQNTRWMFTPLKKGKYP